MKPGFEHGNNETEALISNDLDPDTIDRIVRRAGCRQIPGGGWSVHTMRKFQVVRWRVHLTRSQRSLAGSRRHGACDVQVPNGDMEGAYDAQVPGGKTKGAYDTQIPVGKAGVHAMRRFHVASCGLVHRPVCS